MLPLAGWFQIFACKPQTGPITQAQTVIIRVSTRKLLSSHQGLSLQGLTKVPLAMPKADLDVQKQHAKCQQVHGDSMAMALSEHELVAGCPASQTPYTCRGFVTAAYQARLFFSVD